MRLASVHYHCVPFCHYGVSDEAEKGAVVRVLARVNGNLSKAAELLGVSRPTLYDLMDRFGLR